MSFMLENEQVLEKFGDGFDCAQVVLEHYSEKFGLSNEMARKVSSGFGAGCMRGETCGAIVGAYMALGLKYGICGTGDEGATEKVANLKAINEFNEKFKKAYNSFECKGLLNTDISTAEGVKEISEKNLMVTFCPKLVSDVTVILDELM